MAFFPFLTYALKFKKKTTKFENEAANYLQKCQEIIQPIYPFFKHGLRETLLTKACPYLKFDKDFTNSRMKQICSGFNFNDFFNDANSTKLYAQSGTLNGNPFLIATDFQMNMGTKIYTGTLTIS
ncbi:UNVERIFIED_CONTAM: hypothetical protein O8I53_07820 [Campylobacter lari]